MRKIALTILIFGMTFGVAGAASVNGDFEGNPIVKVQSAGQELKVEDVPATIYNGRTVVPVYLLRQLGANVDWNAEKYSVNITLPDSGKPQQPQQPQPDAAQQELQLLKNTYQWLQDTDTAMILFAQNFQLFSTIDINTGNIAVIENDFKKLTDAYNESQQMAVKVQGNVQEFETVRSIITSQQKAYDQLTQAKNLLQLKQTVNTPDLNSKIPAALLSANRAVLENQLNTSSILHKLQAKEMKLN